MAGQQSPSSAGHYPGRSDIAASEHMPFDSNAGNGT